MSTTCWRKYRLRSSGVRRSTLRPPSRGDNAISMPAMPKRPGARPGANSTNTSTSLSGPKSSRNAEPKIASRRMPCARQKSASSGLGIDSCAFMAKAPYHRYQDRPLHIEPQQRGRRPLEQVAELLADYGRRGGAVKAMLRGWALRESDSGIGPEKAAGPQERRVPGLRMPAARQSSRKTSYGVR